MRARQVDLKLQGIDQMRSPTPRSVDGQVARLINDATDVHNLCQSIHSTAPTLDWQPSASANLVFANR